MSRLDGKRCPQCGWWVSFGALHRCPMADWAPATLRSAASNCAVGVNALQQNTTGGNNYGIGEDVLTGGNNYAVGEDVLHLKTTGGNNCSCPP